jgi:hypothetical protein
MRAAKEKELLSVSETSDHPLAVIVNKAKQNKRYDLGYAIEMALKEAGYVIEIKEKKFGVDVEIFLNKELKAKAYAPNVPEAIKVAICGEVLPDAPKPDNV